jgi:ethanolamine ammonia-lyase small subunit
MAPSMKRRLNALDLIDAGGAPKTDFRRVAQLYASYAQAGGDRRSRPALEEEGSRRLHELRERGLDLGIQDEQAAIARLDAIYSHARAALYATLDEHAIASAATNPVRVRTVAASRDQYLGHPAAGERLREDDARAIAALYSSRRPRVQVVISDGLNANAVNEHLRALLPEVRRTLFTSSHHVGDRDIVVENGRVRAGYEIGGLTGAAIVIHLVGERPGTGLNTLSAYITYGLDASGRSRWSRSLDHSATTAVCGIHPKGKPPQTAAAEIARTVSRIVELRRSGVALSY